MAPSPHLNKDQFVHLFHGTTDEAASKIDTEGLKANPMGVVYGSETYERAESWARQRVAEINSQRTGAGDMHVSPMMVEFRAHKDKLSKPWSQRHDWAHSGNVPARQVKTIYGLD